MHAKETFYDRISDRFDELMNDYDVKRRLEIVFHDLLPADLTGKLVLDAGAGSGWFSREAAKRGAIVVSLDIGTALLRVVSQKTPSMLTAGDIQSLPFRDNSFDIIISSEVIEHTVDPALAVRELGRTLKKDGLAAITCPNKVWQPVVRLASLLRLRPFQGYENFPSFRQLDDYIRAAGLRSVDHFGFHPWPFQFTFLTRWSRRCDLKFGRGVWRHWMINQAVAARKDIR